MTMIMKYQLQKRRRCRYLETLAEPLAEIAIFIDNTFILDFFFFRFNRLCHKMSTFYHSFMENIPFDILVEFVFILVNRCRIVEVNTSEICPTLYKDVDLVLHVLEQDENNAPFTPVLTKKKCNARLSIGHLTIPVPRVIPPTTSQ